MTKYVAERLRAGPFLLLEKCGQLLDAHMGDMNHTVRRNFAFAFFQGCAETFAFNGDSLEANQAVALSRDIAIHGPEAVIEAHRKRIAQ